MSTENVPAAVVGVAEAHDVHLLSMPCENISFSAPDVVPVGADPLAMRQEIERAPGPL